MIWLKSWRECRFRLFLCLLVCASLLLIGLFPVMDMVKAPRAWSVYCRLLMTLLISLAVGNLAGSGINSQSTWGMFHGFHPSMYFLLSLPVSRRRALLVRAVTGAGLSVGIILLGTLSFAVLAPLRGAVVSPKSVFAAVAFLSLLAWPLYGFVTLLTTFLDEIWAGVLGFGFAGAFIGAGVTLPGGPRGVDPLAWFAGDVFLRTGNVGWPAVFCLILLGAACLAASAYIVERKEY